MNELGFVGFQELIVLAALGVVVVGSAIAVLVVLIRGTSHKKQ